jgi:type II secretory pathway pseudopilin PulG
MINISQTKIPSFTVLELIVVLGVIAAIAGVGITGMIGFRRNVQLQEATSSFISTIRTVQNMARTGTLSRYVVKSDCADQEDPFCRRADAFAVYFDSRENYSIRYCLEVDFAGEQRLTCGVESLNVKPSEFNPVVIYPNQETGDKCQGIVFKRLTGEVSAIGTDSLAEESNTGLCTIDLELEDFGGSKRRVQVNLEDNSIYQEQAQ